MIVYWLVRLCGFVLQYLPLQLGYALAGVCGDMTFLAWRIVWRRRYQVLLDNMRHVLGRHADPVHVRRVARQSLRNYCKYVADFFRFPLLKPHEVEGAVVFSGWEHLDAALAGGRGLIFVSLHMGNWDLGGAALAQRKFPLNVVVEDFRPEKLNQLIQGTRRRLGMKTIPMEGSVRHLLRALRQNEALALLIDRPLEGTGVQVSFFGHPVSVPMGAAALALRTGARVLPAGMVRLPDNRYLAMVDNGIDFHPNGDYQADVKDLTQRIMSSLEDMVRKYPDQWYMFRRMWTARSG